MPKIDDDLVNLARDVVELAGNDKRIELGEGTDYQGQLDISWNGSTFEAYLTVYSEPHTSYGGYYDQPEIHWREQEDEFEAVKIRDVADWLKRDWGFGLIKTTPHDQR